jgi:hypothetical protein
LAYLGLPHGFVNFGTLAHAILLHLHHYGPTTSAALAEDLRGMADEPLKAISANLCRLHRGGFIYKIGRARARASDQRSSTLYSLEDSRTGVGQFVKLMSSQERSRRWRERKARNVNSVFNFKGQIKL